MQGIRALFQTVVVLVCLVVVVTWKRYHLLELISDEIQSPDGPLSFGNFSLFAALENNTTTSLVESDNENLILMDKTPHNVAENFIQTWASSNLTFFLLAPPNYTSDILTHYSDKASRYYSNHLNEESVEIWLHRSLASMTVSEGNLPDPSQADFILIAGYLHLNLAIQNQHNKKRGKKRPKPDHTKLLEIYTDSFRQSGLAFKSKKPHLMLVPSWNPSVANNIGLKALASHFQEGGLENLWSVGFERNEMWQGIPAQRILPIPYVAQPVVGQRDNLVERKPNFVFYAGDERKNAKAWAGCHRDELIASLLRSNNHTKEKGLMNMDVRLVTKTNRLNQSDYNYRMSTSDYCLVLCGDTPSSRSLTSAIVAGCIPIIVGSRLRGLCEPPCHGGFGWRPTGPDNPHLPFPERWNWTLFPEVNEQSFLENAEGVLQGVFDTWDTKHKQDLRRKMEQARRGWIYGWGDPTNSTYFGDAAKYILTSFANALQNYDKRET